MEHWASGKPQDFHSWNHEFEPRMLYKNKRNGYHIFNWLKICYSILEVLCGFIGIKTNID